MNILRIARKIPPCLGGQEYHVVDLSRYQVSNGDSVEINFGLGSKVETGSGINSIRVVPQQLLAAIPLDALQGFLFGLMAFLSHLLRKRNAIDVVHVHGDVMEIVFAWLVSKIYDAVLVATFHAGLSHKRWYRFVASKILLLPNSIICVSSDIGEQVRKISPNVLSIDIIHSGIYRSKYVRQCEYGYSYPLDVVSVGRLHPMKGYEYLLNAVADNCIKDRVHLTLVGDGPSRKFLEDLAESIGVSVRFLGQRTKEEIIGILHGSHLFVSSSVQLGEQTEGTPTVVMEAMAAGLPVVTTDVGGAKALVKDNENGYVIPQADQGSLIAALESYIDHPALLVNQSLKNTEISRQFDWDVIGAKVKGVYEKALFVYCANDESG